MKPIACFIPFFFLTVLLVSCKPDKGPLTRQEADAVMARYLEQEIHGVYLLYLNADTLSESIPIAITWYGESDTVEARNVFAYFIDEVPMANWTHPCRHVWVGKEDGSCTVHRADMGPGMGKWIRIDVRDKR